MNPALPALASSASAAYLDLREIELFLARRLEMLEGSGRKADSSDFLKACTEIRKVLAEGLQVLECRSPRAHISAPRATSRPTGQHWTRPQEDAITFELALALDRFLLDAAEELA